MSIRSGIAALLFLALSFAAAGQTPDQPSEFGTTDEGITVVGWEKFFPLSGEHASDLHVGGRWATGANDQLVAPVEGIPNGAVLTQVVFYYFDNDAGPHFSGRFCRSWAGSDDGDEPGAFCPVNLTNNGAPGDDTIFEDVEIPILYRTDLNEDGEQEVVHYWLLVTTLPTNGSTGIRQVRLRWRRQVSPAPATATFNDMPASHPFFQFVEALAASGITSGCGSGNYCPDAPLTRGQMAVFLARVLGLHWPWDAP